MNGQQLQHPGELALYMRDHTARIEYALGGNYPWHTATSADHAAFDEYMGRLEPGRFWGAVQVAVASYEQHPTEARAALEKMLRPVLYGRPAGKAIPLTSENRPLAQYVRLEEMEPGEGQRVRDLLRGLPRVEGVDGGYYAPRGLDLAKLLGVADSVVRYTRDAQGNEHDPKSGRFTDQGGGGEAEHPEDKLERLRAEQTALFKKSKESGSEEDRDKFFAHVEKVQQAEEEAKKSRPKPKRQKKVPPTPEPEPEKKADSQGVERGIRKVNHSDIRKVKPTMSAGMGERVQLSDGKIYEYKGISGYAADNRFRINGWERIHLNIEPEAVKEEPSQEKRDLDEFFDPNYQPPPPPGQLFAGESKREQSDKGKLHIPARQPNPARPMTEEETREFFKPRSDEPEEEQGRLFQRDSMAFQYTKDASGHEHDSGTGEFTGSGGGAKLPKLKRKGKKQSGPALASHEDVADALGKHIEHSGKVLATMRHGAPNTAAETQRIAAETGLPNEQVHGIIDRLDSSGHIRVDYDPVTKEHTFNLKPPKKT